ncbi:MAG: ABC transporter ATP-binding protein [Candidatus Limiplasma sp.]|nr:ABC transporter ATP-binding protein [Candidatus Limiplasma sp.]
MIQIKHLSKFYGNEQVLKDIDVIFEKGTIYGLVGSNGCGKTTLMRCICGFSKPTSGEVYVNGKQVGKDVDFAPSTGIIIEAPGFLPHYSGLRNLQILANISGKASMQRAIEVMRLVDLNPDDKKPVGKYSLGMRQRLGLAQAMMENPDILMLDEPFNGLDRNGMQDIRQLLQRLKKQGKLIILVSHYAQEIEDNCDIVWEIAHGRLVLMRGQEKVTA